MMRSLVVASTVLAFAGCSGEPPQNRTGAADTAPTTSASPEATTGAAEAGAPQAVALVGDSAVGCLEIGAPMEEVRRACGEIEDTTIHLEGMAQEAAWVNVRQGRALAEIVNGSVWRISVEDPGPTTRDSISVGTPVRTLANLPSIRIVHGEGMMFARTDAHCGKSFGIRGLPYRPQRWTPTEIAELPDAVQIVRILVLGRCDHP